MIYFPSPYPDELMYSVFCRYYVHSGCLTHKMALEAILYKRHCNPSKEFLGHLNPQMQEFLQNKYSLEKLVMKNTMFPQYARFVPLCQKKTALHNLCYDFTDPHHLFAVLPRNETDRHMKYCPLCVIEDREKYGETYWHRIHQIRNMTICPYHSCILESSTVSANSEQTFTFEPAEHYATITEAKMVNSATALKFAEFMTEIFNAPLDLEKDIPISAIFYHLMLGCKYMKGSETTRYTKRLADDMLLYYHENGIDNVASIYQIQRILLGNRYDFSAVCQIAYFLCMSISDLTTPNLTQAQIEREQSIHTWRNQEPIDWQALDDETAPLLEQIAKTVYSGTETQRPERVSEKLIYRELGLPAHRLENLPKCKVIYEKYKEPYEENWARRIMWAYEKLKQEGKPFYWSDIRRISGVKKSNLERVIPYIKEYTDLDTYTSILKLTN